MYFVKPLQQKRFIRSTDLATTISDWLDEIVIKETIKDLSEREKRILSLRFMQGKTQMEVSKEIGISQAQVSRLEKNVINRIKGK